MEEHRMRRVGIRVPGTLPLVALLLLLGSAKLFPFGPAAHIVILEQATRMLPHGSFIRQSLESYPGIGAAGANGPDINYASFRGLLTALGFGYAPWADRYHYHLVGTFAAAQIREALASRDPQRVAWAAGWITHVTGDLCGHGTFVNAEAGVALDNPAGMDVHHVLESSAEPYVWTTLGGHPSGSHSPDVVPRSSVRCIRSARVLPGERIAAGLRIRRGRRRLPVVVPDLSSRREIGDRLHVHGVWRRRFRSSGSLTARHGCDPR